MDGVFLGLAGRLGQDPLQLEAALRLVDLDPQAADEFGERRPACAARLRIGVRAAEEPDVLLRQERRHRLVGREHELLDHLVALVVGGEVGADDLPLVAQVDLDLGHVQLQRPLVRWNRQRRRIIASSSMAPSIRATSGVHAPLVARRSGAFITA